MDHPEFVIDASDYDGSTPGTYTIVISLTNDYSHATIETATYDVEVVGEVPTGDKITVPDGFEATLYGDVNLDGTVDVADVVALNTLLLGTGEFEVLQLVNADCARDYVVDSTDSTLLMNYVGMLIEGDKLGK